VKYRLFGRHTGLRVSELALGTGKFGRAIAPDQARQILAAYADAGGRFIDTAEGYQGGESERLIGEFVGAQRDDYVIGTKYGVGLTRTEAFGQRGNSRKAMTRAVEGSLRRLNTDYIDVYWTHGYDATVPLEEVMAGLDHLVAAGKVLYVGLGNYPAWKIAHAATLAALRGWTPLTAVTFEYGLAERDAERELLPAADAFGLGVAAWSPLGGGFLARPRDGSGAAPRSHLDHWTQAGRPTQRDLTVRDTVHAIASELGVDAATVGYAWLLDKARQSTTALVPIIAASTPAQLSADLAALTLRLSPDHLKRLDSVGRPDLGEPHVHNRISDPLFDAGEHYIPVVPAT